MAAVAAGCAHRIEWVAIFFFCARPDRTLVARIPEASVWKAEVVTKLVTQHANIEVIISEPNARSANVGDRSEYQEWLRTRADDIDIKLVWRITSIRRNLARIVDQLCKIVVVCRRWLGQAQGFRNHRSGLGCRN